MERVNKAVMDIAKVETRSLLEELQVTKRNSGDKNFKWNVQHDPAEILGIIARNLQDALYWDEIETKPHTHLTCRKCKKVSSSPAQDQPEPFLILDTEIEMQKCINAYGCKRYVEKQCPHCESTNVAIENRFHRAPEVLVVQLNRSKPSGKKDQTEVKKSNIIFFTHEEERVMEKYVLKAVLCHQGENTEAGHYITYAKHGHIWYHFNGHSVLKPPQGTIISCLKSKMAYMYVYEKLKRPPN
jgi:ubiquitin C-terminal hydrolase